LRQDAALQALVQVAVETGASHDAEAAFLCPLEEDVAPFRDGARASPLPAGYGVGHVVTELLGYGPEAVDFDFVGVLEHQGVYQATDLREGHGVGSFVIYMDAQGFLILRTFPVICGLCLNCDSFDYGIAVISFSAA